MPPPSRGSGRVRGGFKFAHFPKDMSRTHVVFSGQEKVMYCERAFNTSCETKGMIKALGKAGSIVGVSTLVTTRTATHTHTVSSHMFEHVAEPSMLMARKTPSLADPSFSLHSHDQEPQEEGGDGASRCPPARFII